MKNSAKISASLSLSLVAVLGISLAQPARSASGKQPVAGQEVPGNRLQNLTFEPVPANTGIVGINYTSGAEGFPVIADICPGSPAAAADLKVDDAIIAVDGLDARYIGYLHLQKMLSGQAGSTVKIKVQGADGNSKDYALVRKKVSAINATQSQKMHHAKWQATGDEAAETPLLDLPFALLSLVQNKPSLFEFAGEKEPDIGEQFKKHSDGAYILNHCQVVRIEKTDPHYEPLRKAMGLSGAYNLVPVTAPWLVTVKSSDVIHARATSEQLEHLAQDLIHNSIKVQVSKSAPRAGLAHRAVYKRSYRSMPPHSGVAGLGFGADAAGNVVVTKVFKNSPAAKAGIAPGDEIITIDDKKARHIGLEHIQADFIGAAGKVVKMQVRSNATVRDVSLSLADMPDDDLAHLSMAVYAREQSTDPFDSDEFELPCCMIGQAQARPTIFEFVDNEGVSGVKPFLKELEKWHIDDPAMKTHDLNDLQVVRYTPASPDYEALRNYFGLKSNYAAWPVYTRTKHKTYKEAQILKAPPQNIEQALPLIAP